LQNVTRGDDTCCRVPSALLCTSARVRVPPASQSHRAQPWTTGYHRRTICRATALCRRLPRVSSRGRAATRADAPIPATGPPYRRGTRRRHAFTRARYTVTYRRKTLPAVPAGLAYPLLPRSITTSNARSSVLLYGRTFLMLVPALLPPVACRSGLTVRNWCAADGTALRTFTTIFPRRRGRLHCLFRSIRDSTLSCYTPTRQHAILYAAGLAAAAAPRAARWFGLIHPPACCYLPRCWRAALRRVVGAAFSTAGAVRGYSLLTNTCTDNTTISANKRLSSGQKVGARGGAAARLSALSPVRAAVAPLHLGYLPRTTPTRAASQ